MQHGGRARTVRAMDETAQPAQPSLSFAAAPPAAAVALAAAAGVVD